MLPFSQVTLVTETSKRHHGKRAEEVEALLLEEKLLMVILCVL